MGLCSQGLDSVLSFRPPWIFFSTRHYGNVSWKKKKKRVMLAVDVYPNNILHTFQILAKGDIYRLTEIKDSCLF